MRQQNDVQWWYILNTNAGRSQPFIKSHTLCPYRIGDDIQPKILDEKGGMSHPGRCRHLPIAMQKFQLRGMVRHNERIILYFAASLLPPLSELLDCFIGIYMIHIVKTNFGHDAAPSLMNPFSKKRSGSI
jgi:hypothetical protein